MKIFRRFADVSRNESLSTRLRKKRFILFKCFISSLPYPLKIIDIGGTQNFWERMEFCNKEKIEITLINLSKVKVTYPNFRSISGDARNMQYFKEREFDVVFSNSVIEHLGTLRDQEKMANEIQRIGKSYFIQTPNYYFPFEPHFLTLGFHFLPIKVRAFLLTKFDLGWFSKTNDYNKSIEIIKSIRLLRKRDLKKLFPNANIVPEKILGFTKSFIVYGQNS